MDADLKAGREPLRQARAGDWSATWESFLIPLCIGVSLPPICGLNPCSSTEGER